MKMLLCILSLLLLSACVTPRPFDNAEYLVSTSVTVNASRAVHQCLQPTGEITNFINEMMTSTLLLSEYLKNKPDSKDLVIMAQNEENMILDVMKHDESTVSYCVFKFTNIQASSRILSRVLGNSGDFNLCDDQIKERFNYFTKSYEEKHLTQSEYGELVNDVTSMKNISAKGCTVDSHRKMDEDIQFIETNLPNILKL